MIRHVIRLLLNRHLLMIRSSVLMILSSVDDSIVMKSSSIDDPMCDPLAIKSSSIDDRVRSSSMIDDPVFYSNDSIVIKSSSIDDRRLILKNWSACYWIVIYWWSSPVIYWWSVRLLMIPLLYITWIVVYWWSDMWSGALAIKWWLSSSIDDRVRSSIDDPVVYNWWFHCYQIVVYWWLIWY